ncbi:MAG: hypothetical protein ABI224_10845 [Acetobacteraceae bacterium]
MEVIVGDVARRNMRRRNNRHFRYEAARGRRLRRVVGFQELA